MEDINARINWKPGMEVTAETFTGMARQVAFRQRLALRAALGSHCMGLLPGAPFSCNGIFVKNRYEVSRFRCTALLPSGRIVDADEDLAVPIPMLFGDRYYLTVGVSDETVEFERKGVPMLRPRYTYAISTIQEVEGGDLFPLMRFRVADGVFSVDGDFIPPCLMMSADARLLSSVGRLAHQAEALAAHPNLADGEGKRAMLRYSFVLKGCRNDTAVSDFVSLTHEIAQAIDYYIVRPNRQQPVEIPEPRLADVQDWLAWMDDYMKGASVILDGVVLPDTAIDYETLLAQAKQELYQQLHPELIRQLLADMKQELEQQLHQRTEQIREYVNGELKAAIMEQLASDFSDRQARLSDMLTRRAEEMSREISDSLYEKIYFDLFENLFNALYVPEPEDEKFVPLI